MNTKTITWLLYSMLMLGAILAALQFYYHVNEDAWISFKYARNLADGYGLVSNPGDVTQEGYSNLTLVLLTAFLKWAFQANIVHSAKIIGILSLLGIIFLTPAIVRLLLLALERYLLANQHMLAATPLTERKTFYLHSLSWLIMLPIAGSQYMSFWTTQGLETILYALTVWVMVYLTLQIILLHHYHTMWLLAILGFFSLNTRPEGLMNFPIAISVIVISVFLEQPFGAIQKTSLFKTLGTSLALFAVLVAALFSFKLCYFGNILANPSLVKLATAIWLNPYPYFIDYWKAKGIIFTMVTLLALVGGTLTTVKLFKQPAGQALINIILVCLAFLSSQVFFIYYSGGDYMPYSRFIITHYPLLILTIVWLLFVQLNLSYPRIGIRNLLGLSVMLGSILVVSAMREEIKDPKWYEVGFTSPTVIHQVINSGHYLNAETLNQKMTNQTGYYATSEFGYLPYHVAAKGLDTMGLNQKEIARNFKLYGFAEAAYANRDFILSKKPVTILEGRYYRQPDGKLFIDPNLSWVFKSYLESDFFWHNYTTQVPNKYEEWIYSDWNGKFQSTPSIKRGETTHNDKLMYGFYPQPSQIGVAPLARVLLGRRANDKFLNVEGTIADITKYPNQENVIEIRVNDQAVGDRLFAQQVVKQTGKFLVKVLLDDLTFRQGDDTLITLRGSNFQSNLDNKPFSFWFEGIYFSKD